MTEQPDATITPPPPSEGTAAAVANLVDFAIQREYGHDVTALNAAARDLALAGLTFDLRDFFVSLNGSDHRLRGYVESQLSILVRDGLAERACQWRKLHPEALTCSHHYEHDVPPIDGALLCGTHHIEEYQARN
ncbi:hypothetical protein JNW90_24185 [Micromonospora sp. STR1s_5]|nr:hypothetical protein [Micromonospora sp. STR1s_5]